MDKRNKIILICAMLLITIIIVIIGVILNIITSAKNEGTDLNSNTEFEKKDTYIQNSNIVEVKEKNKYFAVQKIVNSYFYYIQEINGDIPYYLDEQYKAEVLQQQREEGLNAIKNMSYDYYNGVSDNTILKGIKDYSNYDITIESMYVSEKNSSISIYFLDVMIDNEKIKLVIKLDSQSMTFCVYPNEFVDKINETNEEVLNSISDDNIEKNDYNTFKYTNITDEYMSKLYFNMFKEQLNNNIKEAFNTLDIQYSNKRFGTLEKFTNYAKSLIQEDIQINQYIVKKYDEYTEYICKDQYDNLYTFKEKAIMNYTVTLDTYTLEQPKFNEEYAKATNQTKVMMNIDKFFQMINAKDYSAAYKLLNEDFKQNYFRTETQFENYMKQRVFVYNDVEYVSYNDDIASVFTYNLIVKNKLDNTQKTNFTIIMQLKQGTDFEMSFSIQ